MYDTSVQRDRWEKLWMEAQCSDAMIIITGEDCRVFFRYNDGSEWPWFWSTEEKEWKPMDNYDFIPGDIAARDTL